MIRWRYVLPRLLVVLAILAAVRPVLSPLVSYATVRALQAVTGAQVELAEVTVSLFPPAIRYHGVQVANPRSDKAFRNLASAEAIELSIDGGALLRRRYVVHDAQITGLQFDSDRLTSGHLPESETAADDEPSVAMRWLADLFASVTDAAVEQARVLGESSETFRRGDQIRRRWKAEYTMLADRAAELEKAIAEVQQRARGIENPLRDWARIDATLTQAKEIQQELLLVRQSLDRMPADFQQDLLTMEQAKQTDLQRVREALPVDLSAGDQLGSGLLRQLVQSQIDRVRGYLDTGRAITRWTLAEPKVQRQRGEQIALAGRQEPSVLIRRCQVSGALRADRQSYQLVGILENLTPQAALRQEPLRARIKLQGEQTIRLDYVRDDSSPAAGAQERLTLHWPQVAAPAVRLGSADALDVDVRGGHLELWVQIDACGDQLSGRLVSRRQQTQIDLQASEKIADTPMFAAFQQRVAGLDRIDIDASFTGTWHDLDLALSTNLSGALNSAIREATTGQIAATQAELETEIQRHYSDQVTGLQQWLVEQQTASGELLSTVDSTLQEVSRKVLSETRKADNYLGRLKQLPTTF